MLARRRDPAMFPRRSPTAPMLALLRLRACLGFLLLPLLLRSSGRKFSCPFFARRVLRLGCLGVLGLRLCLRDSSLDVSRSILLA